MLASIDQTISLIAPAKINLALHVTGRRNDGYHLLDSLVVFAGFGDRISVSAADIDSFHMSGPYGHALRADGSNLVLKARDSLRVDFPEQAFPVAITLEKHLPIASGIGGGSSDAAATLRALIDLWDIEIPSPNLTRLGLALGADLPMCLLGKPLIARGIGEELEQIAKFPHLPIVLANNGAAVSTPQVFGALRKRNNPALPALPELHAISDVCTYLDGTHNHLFPATMELMPTLNDTMTALHSTKPLLVRMSGSGATCFAIYDSDEAATAAASKLRATHPTWFIADTYCGEEGY
ncbi:4-(cytidine 5'-diphospho)-2-C-methyl-D-erythritol kinase [Phyllobacterium sp. YR531]|uniref:4-(cytidine 5'-diphospho)-2-C-methyl-D-erythritol kinase n=1 Tax=Phyllobacterium sp. YR531 TaxID=1144343 RepID=UPI00026FCC29|nr:4-(cytidine 5'-diphospho)-2-C-methyl-D-erythritol kinase [Phyllobacterium sp. YR531]EJN03041.1 4-diphosphocytidyl-2C-methyl-D-erythritol kinase [Phyllobacterium sp. YR531]